MLLTIKTLNTCMFLTTTAIVITAVGAGIFSAADADNPGKLNVTLAVLFAGRGTRVTNVTPSMKQLKKDTFLLTGNTFPWVNPLVRARTFKAPPSGLASLDFALEEGSSISVLDKFGSGSLL